MVDQANGSVDVSTFSQPKPSEANAAIADFMQGVNPLSPEEEQIISEEDLPDIQREVKGITAQIDNLGESKEMTYEQRLKEINITMGDAAKIIDDLMTEGEFQKTYKLTKKTQVTFRTRGFRDQERLQNKIEEERPNYLGTVGMLMSRMNLASSLAQMGDKKFVLDPKGEPKAAMQFVRKLPYPIFNLLLQKLSKFDELVMTVLDEGAVENF